MKISESRKKANRKWDSEHMATVGTRVRKETADLFRAAALDAGTTPAALLKNFVLDYISGTSSGKDRADSTNDN